MYQNQLAFISEEDKKEIQQTGSSRTLNNFLVKYREPISQTAKAEGVSLNDMTNTYVDLIMKAKYFEDCLKASSEFDIPLVIVDKTYYFNKILSESLMYDNKDMNNVSEFYSQADELRKKQMFNMVAQGADVKQLMQTKKSSSIKIGL